jgi:hypothetical protein
VADRAGDVGRRRGIGWTVRRILGDARGIGVGGLGWVRARGGFVDSKGGFGFVWYTCVVRPGAEYDACWEWSPV